MFAVCMSIFNEETNGERQSFGSNFNLNLQVPALCLVNAKHGTQFLDHHDVA